MFKIIKKDECTGARIAELSTKNGIIETPVFMPVGTIGTVKSLSPFEIYDEGFKVMLGNTYHLFLRPGIDIIKKFGSLRNFKHNFFCFPDGQPAYRITVGIKP